MYIVCGQCTVVEDPPILRIDLASPVPAYRQIAAGLRILLVEGELPPGTRLPTIRELAMDLGVHANTVAEGYRLLAEEGWLDLRRRRGATVLERPRRVPGPEARDRWIRRLNELLAEAVAEGIASTDLAAALNGAAQSLRMLKPEGETR